MSGKIGGNKIEADGTGNFVVVGGDELKTDKFDVDGLEVVQLSDGSFVEYSPTDSLPPELIAEIDEASEEINRAAKSALIDVFPESNLPI